MQFFEWDKAKDKANQKKHGVSFDVASAAFKDEKRLIFEDTTHSTSDEKRYFCIGKVEGEVLTVRFTLRKPKIRIFGAAYWRKGKKLYEKSYEL